MGRLTRRPRCDIQAPLPLGSRGSELKAKQLAVAMGNDHFPRLEKVITPLIGPAASARSTVTIGCKAVPAVATMCLDLSAARSA